MESDNTFNRHARIYLSNHKKNVSRGGACRLANCRHLVHRARQIVIRCAHTKLREHLRGRQAPRR